ncbi:unnamed protein product [Meloidogyne enterolobii]|uniref:Uncharacterized protein n=1 Tax=Meloidogyne enterolobii TaxID=390850 RepID=A0ACB1A4S6_MELEN
MPAKIFLQKNFFLNFYALFVLFCLKCASVILLKVFTGLHILALRKSAKIYSSIKDGKKEFLNNFLPTFLKLFLSFYQLKSNFLQTFFELFLNYLFSNFSQTYYTNFFRTFFRLNPTQLVLKHFPIFLKHFINFFLTFFEPCFNFLQLFINHSSTFFQTYSLTTYFPKLKFPLVFGVISVKKFF